MCEVGYDEAGMVVILWRVPLDFKEKLEFLS